MGMMALRGLNTNQNMRKPKFTRINNGNIKPNIANLGWHIGSKWSEKPASNMTSIVAMLAPEIN
jgi:hypothetical protein